MSKKRRRVHLNAMVTPEEQALLYARMTKAGIALLLQVLLGRFILPREENHDGFFLLLFVSILHFLHFLLFALTKKITAVIIGKVSAIDANR